MVEITVYTLDSFYKSKGDIPIHMTLYLYFYLCFSKNRDMFNMQSLERFFLQQAQRTFKAECCGIALGLKTVELQRRENGGRVKEFM